MSNINNNPTEENIFNTILGDTQTNERNTSPNQPEENPTSKSSKPKDLDKSQILALNFSTTPDQLKKISNIHQLNSNSSFINNNIPNYQIVYNNLTNLNNINNTNPVNTNAIIFDNEINPAAEQCDSESNTGDNLVLNYTSSKNLYSMAFQKSQNVCLAVGSLEKSLNNKIEILDCQNDKIKLACSENQEYPITKLMWGPGTNYTNMLASSSDIIRLFKYDEEENKLSNFCSLHNKKSKYSSPLTSFDWNSKNNSILGTASIDTTCTIWDLNKNTIRTQLIAHDKEVFDIAFSQNEHIFISTGADGSIRLFDLRSLDHSTIMYETKDLSPINKIAYNTENSYLISAVVWDNDTVHIIDSRVAMSSLVDLKSHTSAVTGTAWAPQSGTHICSVGEDKLVLIWNVESQMDNVNCGPILSYKAPDQITNVNWCADHSEWIAITFKNQLQLLRV